MHSEGTTLVRVIAKVRALLSRDWRGRAGQRFRATAKQVSDFAEQHGLRAEDIVEDAVTLGRRKIEGLASREYAAAVKDFADSERTKIEIELQRRTMESRARKEEADARKAEADAELAQLELASRKAKLFKELKEIGVILQTDSGGNYNVLPLPKKCDLSDLNADQVIETSDETKNARLLEGD